MGISSVHAAEVAVVAPRSGTFLPAMGIGYSNLDDTHSTIFEGVISLNSSMYPSRCPWLGLQCVAGQPISHGQKGESWHCARVCRVCRTWIGGIHQSNFDLQPEEGPAFRECLVQPLPGEFKKALSSTHVVACKLLITIGWNHIQNHGCQRASS